MYQELFKVPTDYELANCFGQELSVSNGIVSVFWKKHGRKQEFVSQDPVVLVRGFHFIGIGRHPFWLQIYVLTKIVHIARSEIALPPCGNS